MAIGIDEVTTARERDAADREVAVVDREHDGGGRVDPRAWGLSFDLDAGRRSRPQRQVRRPRHASDPRQGSHAASQFAIERAALRFIVASLARVGEKHRQPCRLESGVYVVGLSDAAEEQRRGDEQQE
jgi:hypothetical protein